MKPDFKIRIIYVGDRKDEWLKRATRMQLDKTEKVMKSLGARGKVVECTEVEEILLRGSYSEAQAKRARDAEGAKIMEKAEGSYAVVLDINAPAASVERTADMIKTATERGISAVSFIIGGSTGLSDEVKKFSDGGISFSHMTFPRQIAKLILAAHLAEVVST